MDCIRSEFQKRLLVEKVEKHFDEKKFHFVKFTFKIVLPMSLLNQSIFEEKY